VIFFSSVFFSTQTGSKVLFWFILQIPVLWKMVKYYYLTKMCRYMKVMLKAGMNFLDIFLLLRDILWVPAYQDMIEKVVSWLQRWDSIYDALKHETDLIPSNVAVLIKVWEETANLDTSIDNILNMYQEELNVLIDRLAKLIEPIMLVFIGWIVVFIAMAVFWIIFQVMDSAGV
jgi:type IV pilus assembly protein PilC